MKKFLVVLALAVLSACGGGDTSTNDPSGPAGLSGTWSGDFSTYTADMSITTTDNQSYTGHIIIRQKALWPVTTPEWFSADIQGLFNLPATVSNMSSTYVLNGGNAGVTIVKDNVTNKKIACGVNLYYGSNSFVVDIDNPQWLTKQ